MLSIIRAAPVEITAPAEAADHAPLRERFVRHVIDGNIAVVPLGRFGLTTGLFLGASAIAAYHTTDTTPWFTTCGAVADAGVAFLIGRQLHLTIGGGAQLAHTDVESRALTEFARLLVASGISPRLTIALGHAP